MAVLITRKYVNNSNEILNKRTYKQTRFQERSRIKDVVERCAYYHKLNKKSSCGSLSRPVLYQTVNSSFR